MIDLVNKSLEGTDSKVGGLGRSLGCRVEKRRNESSVSSLIPWDAIDWGSSFRANKGVSGQIQF